MARRAKQAISFSDYKEGFATAQYRAAVDHAAEIAEKQKARVDPMYHEKIDSLLDTYARKLAENLNDNNRITASCPSVMISGAGNFPVAKKQKQVAALDKNMEEYQHIEGILDKIRSVGTGGISSDDPQAVQKLKAKLTALEALQDTMKQANAYYRKHKTVDGCPVLTAAQIADIKAGMARSWRSEPKPFESFELTNNNANIRRLKERIAELEKRQAAPAPDGWTFDGGEVVMNKEENRVQILFDGKPDEQTRGVLKSHGFRWAPSQGAWQRQLTDNAIAAARKVTNVLCSE
jgi:hypothetical protein